MGTRNINPINQNHQAQHSRKNKEELRKHVKTQSWLFHCNLKVKSQSWGVNNYSEKRTDKNVIKLRREGNQFNQEDPT